MNDVSIRLEHVYLLNGLDGLSVQLLQGLLELPVVGTATGGGTLDLAAGSSLSTEHVVLAIPFDSQASDLQVKIICVKIQRTLHTS